MTEPTSTDTLVRLASKLAPEPGYNPTAIAGLRLLRSEIDLYDVPVLYQPGAVFVCQGSKAGMLDGHAYLYDEQHYLAVSVPVPFRMQSKASPERPLLAVYVDFDMQLVADILAQLDVERLQQATHPPRSLMSTPMEPTLRDTLHRLLLMLQNPQDTAVLAPSLMRELHYRILTGPHGGAMIAALQHKGAAGNILRSLHHLREHFQQALTVNDLAQQAGMSVPSYHTHFRQLTGTSPMQYLKSMRLHQARLLMAGQAQSVAQAAMAVGYQSASQFSREFKRHFGRTAAVEARWMREHGLVNGEGLE